MITSDTKGLAHLHRAYAFNLEYARELTRDLTTEQMYLTHGAGLENHPAFTLGHLVIASALVVKTLGGKYDVPEGWDDYFRRKGPGDSRVPQPFEPDMPDKDSLLNELRQKHVNVERATIALSNELFSEEIEWRFSDHFPSLFDYLTFMCVTHEAMHLGQVAAWRRATGLDSSLARL